jgi:gliding motility-associated-like protein
LFGYAGAGATIKNLILETPTVIISSTSAPYGAGILIGYSMGATVDNVNINGGSLVSNNVTGGFASAGAIVGWEDGITVSNTTTSASITTNSGFCGGFLGIKAGGNSCFSNCSTSGNVISTGGSRVGGFLGQTDNSGKANFNNCSSSGNVSAVSLGGGFIGYIASSTSNYTNCYATGNVTISSNSGGGFFAWSGSNVSVLTNCYASGVVTGSSTGGFGNIGNGGTFTYNNCFWDTQNSGKTTAINGVGTTPAGLSGRTTTQMKDQNNYVNWDFANTWLISGATNNGYPYLNTSYLTNTALVSVTAASSSQTLCVNTLMTNITHTTNNSPGIGTPSGLPAGVTASWANNTITISGTPTANGTFNYSIPVLGGCGVVATGTIVVNLNTVGAASSTPTICINAVLTNIIHNTTGVTGIGTATGLPSGVTASWASNKITISGTPTASGTFTYTIPVTGGCGNFNATGTITVTNPPASAGTLSGLQAICNASTTTFSSTVSGGTWASSNASIASVNASTGLVTGVASGSATITYTIAGLGGCANATVTISITSTAVPSIPVIGTITQTNCASATGIVALTGLPSSGVWTLTATGGATKSGTGTTTSFSGLPAGTYTFTVSNGSCASLSSSSTTINPQPTVPSAPIVGTITQTNCANATGIVALSGLPSSGVWTVTATGGTTLTGTGTTTSFSGLLAGTYTFTVSNGSCVSNASSIAIINIQPSTPIVPTITVVNNCGNSYLTASGYTGVLTWSTGASAANITVTSAGTYTLTQSNGACTSGVASVTATPLLIPDVTIGTVSSVNNTATVFNIPFTINSGVPTQYSITTGTNAMPGFTNVGLTTLLSSPMLVTIPASTANTYDVNVTFTNTSACSIVKTVNLSVNNPILGTSTIVVTGATTYTYNGVAQGPITCSVIGSTANPTYIYSGIGGTSYGPSATPPTQAGTYQVIATVVADANYNGATSAAYSFTINALSPSIGNSTIVVTGPTQFNYSGANQGPNTAIVNGSNGAITYSYVGTGGTIYGPSAIPPKLPGAYQATATVAGNSSYNGATSAAYSFTITQTIAIPSVNNGKYILNQNGVPSNVRSLVNTTPNGTIPAWCNVANSTCSTTPPTIPTAIGKYVYQVRAYDTTTLMYSDNYVNDTLIIAPPPPATLDSSYVLGVSTNPINISGQVSGITSATFNYFYNNNRLASVPTLGTVFGTKRYAVSQTVNSIESDTAVFFVTLLDPSTIIHLQKIVDSSVLQANSTFNYPFSFIVSNLTSQPITNIVITDNLQNSVSSISEYSIVKTSATGTLVANNLFNGNSDVNLTQPLSSIAAGGKDSVKFVMNLIPKGFNGLLSNIAFVSANTKWGRIDMQSSSNTVANATIKTPTTYYVKDLSVTIPEGFSPNHDGVHDNFVIIRPYNVNLSLEVFNRWGVVVYSSNNYNNEWDGKGSGTFAGQDLIDGGYYYSLKAVDESGKIQVFKGCVIIQR